MAFVDGVDGRGVEGAFGSLVLSIPDGVEDAFA